MDTKTHEGDFLEKLLDGAEVEWVPLGELGISRIRRQLQVAIYPIAVEGKSQLLPQ